LTFLQVGKISLYAASSAIKEVQKLVLDPKYVNFIFDLFIAISLSLSPAPSLWLVPFFSAQNMREIENKFI
jgi:hypothetical protein